MEEVILDITVGQLVDQKESRILEDWLWFCISTKTSEGFS